MPVNYRANLSNESIGLLSTFWLQHYAHMSARTLRTLRLFLFLPPESLPFPFSEFGDVKGELVWIGSDALPPDQIRTLYTFPAKIRLDRQSILINGRAVPLQSGMSVSANIKVRNRTVMSIFTDLFTQKIESLKFVR